MEKDIRWKQRFQIYEFTFELAWKTLKDYLEAKEVDAKFPKDTIKEAFKYELIKDGDTWMDMLEKRNLMAHTYNETNAALAYNLIVHQYYKVLEALMERLNKEE